MKRIPVKLLFLKKEEFRVEKRHMLQIKFRKVMSQAIKSVEPPIITSSMVPKL